MEFLIAGHEVWHQIPEDWLNSPERQKTTHWNFKGQHSHEYGDPISTNYTQLYFGLKQIFIKCSTASDPIELLPVYSAIVCWLVR